MSKLAHIALALTVTLVFLLVTLSILVKVVVTPERIRENLLLLAEEKLGRDVYVGEIDISIFSGVSLNDMRVNMKSAEGNFISARSLVLDYQFLPLLTGDLVIDKILLEQPRVEIIREPGGEFNFSDLIAAPKDTSSTLQNESVEPGSVSSLDLLVNEVSITGGELLFIDRSQNSTMPYRYTVHRFDFAARDITLAKSFPLQLAAELNGSKLSVTGTFDIARHTGDLDFELTALDLVQFAPYYRHALPGKLGSADLALNLVAQIQPQQVISRGIVQLDNLDLFLDAFPMAAMQQAKLSADFAFNYNLVGKKLELSTFFLNLNDAIIGVEGYVDLAGPEPSLALALLLDKLDLRKLLQGLPNHLTKNLQKYSLAGQVDGRLELAGAPGDGVDLLKTADIDLFDVQASVDSLRAGVSGKISYKDQQAQADGLSLKFANQQAQLKFKLSNLPEEVIQGEFQLSADQLDLNRLLAETFDQRGTADRSASDDTQVSSADEIGPFDLPLDLTGSLAVNRMLYKKLALEQVYADLVLKNNHLYIDPLHSNVGGGEFVATVDLNLGVEGLNYAGEIMLDQSQVMTLMTGLIPQSKQSVEGLLQSRNTFSGQGTIPANLLKTLQLKGVVQLQKGRLSGSPLLEGLSTFLGLPELEVLDFETFASRYDLRDGLANLSGQFDSPRARLSPEGTIGIDGALILNLEARIAPELMQKIGIKTGLQQVASDKDGWGVLPLAIRGNLSSPTIAFDPGALEKQVVPRGKDDVTNRLLDKMAPQLEGEQKPVKQLLEGTLNKIFGN